MADLADIKDVGENLIPLIKDLFARAKVNGDKEDRTGEVAVIEKLRKLNSEARDKTSATLNQRLNAMISNHSALTEILIEAAGSSIIDEAEIHRIRVQRRELDDAMGDLMIREAFAPIDGLLSKAAIDDIEDTLERADQDIAQRKQAKAILDNVIALASTSAKIVTKLAVL